MPNEKCVGLLKRKADSAFAPPNKQRKTEKDPNGGVSQFNTSESQIQSQNTDHCDQHENKSKTCRPTNSELIILFRQYDQQFRQFRAF